MAVSNFERMIQLADEVFAVKNDPSQLDVNEEVIERLLKIHPATVSEYDDGNGPVTWVLLLPTTAALMHAFLKDEITEKALFEATQVGSNYDAIYLCSALVLEEFRRKGIVKKLTIDAIEQMKTMHSINTLFVWAFSPEGDKAAEAIAAVCGLPLLKK